MWNVRVIQPLKATYLICNHALSTGFENLFLYRIASSLPLILTALQAANVLKIKDFFPLGRNGVKGFFEFFLTHRTGAKGYVC